VRGASVGERERERERERESVCVCVKQSTGHTHTGHTDRDNTRHRHTQAHDKTPKQTPPTSTYQRSTVARRRCVPPPTPGWVAAPKSACEVGSKSDAARGALVCVCRCARQVVNLGGATPAGVYQLALTRYCHHQYCMVYGIQQGGRWGGA